MRLSEFLILGVVLGVGAINLYRLMADAIGTGRRQTAGARHG